MTNGDVSDVQPPRMLAVWFGPVYKELEGLSVVALTYNNRGGILCFKG